MRVNPKYNFQRQHFIGIYGWNSLGSKIEIQQVPREKTLSLEVDSMFNQ